MLDDCWNQIGVMGDRTCPQLKTHIHCRNCPVFSSAGRSLLERSADESYLQEWTAVLADLPSHPRELGEMTMIQSKSGIALAKSHISIAIFRLGKEQFALPVSVLQEITHPTSIHRLPHRSNQLFLGITHIRGEILFCVSLHHLLGLAPIKTDSVSVDRQRMMVIHFHRDHSDSRSIVKWVFPVDEVYSIYRFEKDQFTDSPDTLTQTHQTFTRSVISWQNYQVNVLAIDPLFERLNQTLTMNN